MSDRDRFQGLCLENLNGSSFMNYYDGFPPEVRLRLQSSDYNLCAACVDQISREMGWEQRNYQAAIDQMEATLRAKETQCQEK